MNSTGKQSLNLFLFIPFSLMLASCTAGSDQFSSTDQEALAGFWYGLWHGIISLIALIIHVFNDSVLVYETNNTGGWYDLGFLFGVIFIWGGGCHVKCKTSFRKERDREWDEVGEKVEAKIMRKMKNWAEDESDEKPDTTNKQDWDETCKKVEKKLKRKLREWAEKE